MSEETLHLAFISTLSPHLWAACSLMDHNCHWQQHLCRRCLVSWWMQRAFYRQCQFKWFHLLDIHIAPMNHTQGLNQRGKNVKEVNFHQGQNLKVITGLYHSLLQRALKGYEKSMLLWTRSWCQTTNRNSYGCWSTACRLFYSFLFFSTAV